MTAPTATDLAAVIADGRWLAHRYDDQADAFWFRWTERDARRQASFLTDADLGPGEMVAFGRQAVTAALADRSGPPLHFIFHSAYCCSTLLVRAFDLPGVSMGLSEPVLLNDLIGLRLRGGEPRRVAAIADLTLKLLARPMAAGERIVVKPSNLVNPLIAGLLDLSPGSSAVMLHAPLETFLGSVARKEVEGRAWVRELMWKLIMLGEARRFGFTEEELYRHTDLQVAALGWLAQQALFAEAAARHPARTSVLDSDTLMSRPVAVMDGIGRLFGMPLDGAAIAAGPAFTRHSKDGQAFDAARRASERDRGLAIHAREIEMVSAWARAVAVHAGVPLAISGFPDD